jgi:hypothetical protein
MATWRLAPTLVVLRDEINKAWPLRDKTSGGAIGNLAHQQSKSDHNPDSRGVVCAIDIDEDLDRPASAHLSFHTGQAVKAVLVDKLIANAKAGKLPQLYYVIYERKIYSQTYGFAARDYSGASAQDHHVHVSVYHDEARADSTAPWGITNDVVETKLRCVSLNVRNKTAVADIPFPSRHWSKRLPALIKYIQHVGPSVIGVQECGNSMAVDLTNGLGPSWTFWGAGTSKVIWNTAKWTAVDQFETTMPFKEFGVTKARPLTMVKLRSVKTGGECWFVSTHFTVNITGLDQSATRREQMRLVIKHLSERPGYERALSWATSTTRRRPPAYAPSLRLLDTRLCAPRSLTKRWWATAPIPSTAGSRPSTRVGGSMTCSPRRL